MYNTKECRTVDAMIESNDLKRKRDIYDFTLCLDLGITPIQENDYCMRHIRLMELIIIRMLDDGLFLCV